MYCQNCGSLLPSNANFCHVCGAKIEVGNLFDTNEEKETPKEELNKDLNESSQKDEDLYSFNQNEDNNGQNKGYYGYYSSPEAQQAEKERMAQKKAFIPGLIGTIGTAFFLGDSAISYLFNVFILNTKYNSGYSSVSEYRTSAANLLNTIGAYLVLATLLGGILGAVGIVTGQKNKSKRAIVFGIISTVLGGISLIFVIFAFVYRKRYIG